MALVLVSPPAAVYTWVVLPDTQFYTLAPYASLEQFEAQTAWILAQRVALNIQGVLHVGDIIEDYNVLAQAQIADASLATLNGVVRYITAHGNHDQIYGSGTQHQTFFGGDRFKYQTGYLGAGTYVDGALTRTYAMAQLLRNNWLVIATGYIHASDELDLETTIDDEGGEPVDGQIRRAKRILQFIRTWAQAYPTRDVVVIFHQSLLADATRAPGYDWVFDNAIAPEPNIKLVLNGHELDPGGAEGRRATTVNGRTVHEMLSNYQSRTNGGDGWLRILTFTPMTRTLDVQTYSPTLDQYETDGASQFSVSY